MDKKIHHVTFLRNWVGDATQLGCVRAEHRATFLISWRQCTKFKGNTEREKKKWS